MNLEQIKELPVDEEFGPCTEWVWVETSKSRVDNVAGEFWHLVLLKDNSAETLAWVLMGKQHKKLNHRLRLKIIRGVMVEDVELGLILSVNVWEPPPPISEPPAGSFYEFTGKEPINIIRGKIACVQVAAFTQAIARIKAVVNEPNGNDAYKIIALLTLEYAESDELSKTIDAIIKA